MNVVHDVPGMRELHRYLERCAKRPGLGQVETEYLAALEARGDELEGDERELTNILDRYEKGGKAALTPPKWYQHPAVKWGVAGSLVLGSIIIFVAKSRRRA